jgi:hypothetical protein
MFCFSFVNLIFGLHLLASSEKLNEPSLENASNQLVYVDIYMTPFSKNRRFFVFSCDSVPHLEPEWLKARLEQNSNESWTLAFHQSEMKNALKVNANFRLNNLVLDRSFDFSSSCFSSDSSNMSMQLCPQRAYKISADSIYYLLKPNFF